MPSRKSPPIVLDRIDRRRARRWSLAHDSEKAAPAFEYQSGSSFSQCSHTPQTLRLSSDSNVRSHVQHSYKTAGSLTAGAFFFLS